jgi:hypothetical protein
MMTYRYFWAREEFCDEVCRELSERGIVFRSQRAITDSSEVGTIFDDDVFRFVIEHWTPQKTASQTADDFFAATENQGH